MWARRAVGAGYWLVCFCVAILALSASAISARAEAPDKISELMEVAGIDSSFDNLGDGLAAGMRQTSGAFSENQRYREKVLAGIEAAAALAFAPEKLKSELREPLGEKLSEADLGAIIAFYKSPLGARMVALAKAANTPEFQSKIRGMAGELLESLTDQPERADVLITLDNSLRLTENAANLAFGLARAMAVGMAAADEKTTSLSEEALAAMDDALKKARPKMTERMKQGIMASLIYTYREASVEDLRNYLKFMTSPAGKKFNEAFTSAFAQVLLKAGDEFGHALIKELGKERI